MIFMILLINSIFLISRFIISVLMSHFDIICFDFIVLLLNQNIYQECFLMMKANSGWLCINFIMKIFVINNFLIFNNNFVI